MTHDTKENVTIPRRWDLLPNALTAIRTKFTTDNDDGAFERLKALLLDERVHARGLWRGSGVQTLPAEEFRFAVLSPDGAGITSLANFAKAPWLEINMAELASALASVSVPRPKKGAGEDDAVAWLIRDIAENPDSPKSERRKKAMHLFGILERAFNDRVWPQALEMSGKKDDLTKAGRKSKSNHRAK